MTLADDPRPDPEAHLARYRRTGDPKDFGAFFDATVTEVHRVAVTLLPDPVAADDAVQETFLTALRLAPGLEFQGRAMPWLVSILRGHVLHLRRSHARRRATTGASGAVVERAAPFSDDPLDGAGDEARAAIEALDEPYRSAALLRWRYGLEPAEIAHVRGEPPGTTRSILYRAFGRLRRAIKAGSLLPLALLGAGAAHGLDAIRARLMREATRITATASAAPAAASGAGGATAAIGGLVVTQKTIMAAAALGLLAIGGTLVVSGAFRTADEATGPTLPAVESSNTTGGASRPDAPTSGALAAHAARKPRAPDAAPAVSGSVVDEQGAPVSGARVFSISAASPLAIEVDAIGEEDERPVGRTITDPTGAFRVPLRGDAGRFEVHVRAEGRSAGVVTATDGEVVRVVLSVARRVAGRVLDEAGKPVVGATVRVREMVGIASRTSETATAADGTYSLAVPPPRLGDGTSASAFSLEVRAAGYAPVIVGDFLLAPENARGVRTFHATLRRGAVVVGRVVDGETDEPIAGAVVRLTTSNGVLTIFRGPHLGHVAHPSPLLVLGEATSDGDGRFRLDHLPPRGSPGSYQGTLLGTAVATRDAWVGVAALIPLIPDRGVHEVTLRMFAAGSVTGRVRYPDGAPAAGIDLGGFLVRGGDELAPHEAPGAPSSARARSGEDGTYRIDVPTTRREPGLVRVLTAPFALPASRSPDTPLAEVLLRAGETATAPDLVLPRPDALRVLARLRVVDPQGDPVANAEVVGSDPPIRLTILGRTDREGRARVARHPSARPVEPPFAVRAGGFAPRVIEIPLVAASAGVGAEPDEQTVVLARGEEIRGRVVRADGSRAAGAIVSASVPGASPGLSAAYGMGSWMVELPGEPMQTPIVSWSQSEADGTFRLADLPPGPFVVVARLARGGRDAYPEPAALRAEQRDVPAGAVGLELRLPADDLRGGGPLVVRLVDAATGRSVAEANVLATRSGGEVPARSLGGGEWSMGWVAEGTWRVRVAAPGYVEASVDGVEVTQGREPASVLVSLRRGSRVVGRVVGPAGVTFASHEMQLTRVESERWSPQATAVPVAADGRFEATGLAAGRYRALVGAAGDLPFGMKPRYAIRAGAYVVVPEGDGEVTVEVHVGPAGVLSVGVWDETRLPYPPMRGFRVPTPEQVAFGASLRVVVLDERDSVVADQRGIHDGGYVGVLGSIVVPAGRYRARLYQGDRVVDEKEMDVQALAPGRRGQRVVLRPPP